jgi:SRSO17 transposase
MERRFELRKTELLADCQVHPAVFAGMTERLDQFAEPFAARLRRPEQRAHTRMYLQGLLSDVERKNAEAIAYRHDEDRQGLQTFLGTAPWDYQPLLEELTCQVGKELGEPDGVIVFDPSAFPKKGRHSVAVARQWCGRLGKVENCQVGIFMGYVSRSEHALVDVRLYVPREWTKDRRRRKECGIPKELRYQTRHEMVLEMLKTKGHLLPHSWIAGDDEMGRPAWFRRKLDRSDERYLLAVPSNTTIRDLEAEPPPYNGRGRQPKQPFQQVRRWCDSLPRDAWTRLEVRDAEKGPLAVEMVKRRVVAKIDRKVGDEETLVVIRALEEDGTWRHDYYLSNAPVATSANEFARVAKAEHRIEECLQRGKSEAGLADYQVRTWIGWHHHITLSLMAAWFLVLEAQRGKKVDAGDHGSTNTQATCATHATCQRLRHTSPHYPRVPTLVGSHRACTALSPQGT